VRVCPETGEYYSILRAALVGKALKLGSEFAISDKNEFGVWDLPHDERCGLYEILVSFVINESANRSDDSCGTGKAELDPYVRSLSIRAGRFYSAIDDGDFPRPYTSLDQYLFDHIRYRDVMIHAECIFDPAEAEKTLSNGVNNSPGYDAHGIGIPCASHTAEHMSVGRMHVNDIESSRPDQPCNAARSHDVGLAAHPDMIYSDSLRPGALAEDAARLRHKLDILALFFQPPDKIEHLPLPAAPGGLIIDVKCGKRHTTLSE
jgi:hypothetical protein